MSDESCLGGGSPLSNEPNNGINRNAFGDNQAEQEEIIGKILFFVEKHWSEVFRFSRRNIGNMNRWVARYGYEKTGKEILEKAKDSSHGRYSAVNLCNYHIIEFRLFYGKEHT